MPQTENPTEISFIQYEDSDFDYVNDLLVSNMKEYFDGVGVVWDRNRYKNEVAKGRLRIVWKNGMRLGFIHVSDRGQSTYINSIQLSPNARNQGIGQKVLLWAESESLSQGKSILELSVFKTSPALKLYQRIGYQIIEDKGSKYLMKKVIG